jgi:hypothetical protein
VTEPPDDGHGEYVAVAEQALRSGDASTALDALGWWELAAGVADGCANAEGRVAVFALFRAQGRTLASTPALGALMAAPYPGTDAASEPRAVAVVARTSRRRGPVAVAVGPLAGTRLLVDRPGHGAAIVDAADVVVRPVDVPGRLDLHEVEIDGAWEPSIDEAAAARARPASRSLGRVALALELLGAAEGALGLAIEHARVREQFGQPIGSFQAVRHLLAWATTDCVAIERAALAAVTIGPAAGGPPERYDEIVKALAGRNARRACERSLQVLGAIGFTAEHDHHHFHSRVLALDALLGTSAELTRDLGRWVRDEGSLPALPRALLATADGAG